MYIGNEASVKVLVCKHQDFPQRYVDVCEKILRYKKKILLHAFTGYIVDVRTERGRVGVIARQASVIDQFGRGGASGLLH